MLTIPYPRLSYNLQITDLTQCGVIVRNGFISVRVWFPQVQGVLTSNDQEVIIMCKPSNIPKTMEFIDNKYDEAPNAPKTYTLQTY